MTYTYYRELRQNYNYRIPIQRGISDISILDISILFQNRPTSVCLK